MTLLFDQNLSYTLVRRLTDVFPGAVHVRELGLDQADDQHVWDIAGARGYTIVSKDWDFFQRSSLYGAPPKVIWLRVGNSSTNQIDSVLRAAAVQIITFSHDADATFLILP